MKKVILWFQVHNALPMFFVVLVGVFLIRVMGYNLQFLNDRLERAEQETQSNRLRVIQLQEKLQALYTPTPTPRPTKSPSRIQGVLTPTRPLTPTMGVKTP
jgi:hypothetical protein